MQTRFRCTCWLEKMPFIAGSFRNGLLRKMPCITVCHIEAPKFTEIDFSPNVRLLSIRLRLLSFKRLINQRKTFVLSAICLHAFWTPLSHMKLLRHYEIITSLFLCPLECSVNGVNSLTHITLTRVTEFFSDVKSGFDSKMKTETNTKDQNPINATQNEWPKGSKHSYQRYYDLPFVVFTIASISIGYFVSLWVMSVMHSGIDSRRVCLFRLHLCKKKQWSQGTSFPNLKLVLFIVLPIKSEHK